MDDLDEESTAKRACAMKLLRNLICQLFACSFFLALGSASAPAASLLYPDDRWWDAAFDVNGLDGQAYAVASSGSNLYVAGSFEYAGSVRARGVARWTGQNWARIGGGVDSTGVKVTALAVDATNVYVGGNFQRVFQSGGAIVPATNIARWNGTSWSALRSGIDSGVLTLSIGQGHLFVGGFFTNADNRGLSNAVLWDGTTWSKPGLGVNGTVTRSAWVDRNLYISGQFTVAGGVAATNLARWDGTNWSPVPGSPLGVVKVMKAEGTNLIVGGQLRDGIAGGLRSGVYRWTGQQWLPLTTRIDGEISDLTVATNAIYVGGIFTEIDGKPAWNYARVDACGWMNLGTGTDFPPSALAAVDDKLYAVGVFSKAGNKPSRNVARWNGGNLPRLEMVPMGASEGNDGLAFAMFTLKVCPAPTGIVTVAYSTSNGTAVAESDYAPVGGSIVFTPQSTVQAIAVPIYGDLLYERDESVFLVITNPVPVHLVETAAAATILNDDPLPSIYIADASTFEGNFGTNVLQFDVSLSSPHGSTVTVDCRILEGTAAEWLDFIPPPTTRVFFPPGTTHQSIAVPVLTDSFLEPDKEFIVQVIGSDPHLPVARADGLGRILNDDVLPALSFNWPYSSSNLYFIEGSDRRTQSIALTLSSPMAEPVAVDFNTVDLTARSGSDYLAANGRMVFPPGSTRQIIPVVILGDNYGEPDKTFTLQISQPTNALLYQLPLTVGVRDDDPLTLPPDHAITLVTTNLLRPTRMEFAPDGRLFVCEQDGAVRIIKKDALLPEPFLKVATAWNSETEAGLLGIAFDPGFPTNQFVYLFYSALAPVNSTLPDGRLRSRISRFVAQGDVALPGSEQLVFELGDVARLDYHHGGDIRFGPDGKLYASAGDNYERPANAQTLTNLFGKVLRLNPDGSIPTDNPFYATASGPQRAIWAFGLRNPFSLAFQRSTGRMLINDVGNQQWEEVNDGRPGVNYGWPAREGPGTGTNDIFRPPLYAYHRTNSAFGRAAITAGVFYEPHIQNFSARYAGSYFFADYYDGIWNMVLSNGVTVQPYATGLPTIDLKVGPDGRLYSMDRYSFERGRIWRFEDVGTHPSFQSIAMQRDGSVELTLNVGTAQNYVLETSPDLSRWTVVRSFFSSSRLLVWREASVGLESRFFRIRVP